MTLPLNFLLNYTLWCTFSFLKVPKLFQSPTDFPPSHSKPSHYTLWNQQTLLILNLCLEHFFSSCCKEVCLDTTCSGSSGGNALLFVSPCRSTLHPCFLTPIPFSLLQKSLLLRAPDNWIYYSIPMLVSIICQTLAHLQPPAEYFNSWFTNFPDHTCISIFSVIIFFTYWIHCPPIQPLSSSFKIYSVLKMPSVLLFHSPTSKLVTG